MSDELRRELRALYREHDALMRENAPPPAPEPEPEPEPEPALPVVVEPEPVFSDMQQDVFVHLIRRWREEQAAALAPLKSQIEALKAANTEMNSRLDAVAAMNAKLDTMLTILTRDHHTATREREAREIALRSELAGVAELEGKINTLAAMMYTQQRNDAGLRERRERDSEIATLKAEVAALRGRLEIVTQVVAAGVGKMINLPAKFWNRLDDVA